MKTIKLVFLTLLLCVLGLFSACNFMVKMDYNIDFVVDGTTIATVGTDGKEIKVPTNPTKENYVFDGWYWDEGEWEEVFSLNSIMDQPLQKENNYKVYAKWKGVDVTITYEDDGEKTQIVTYNEEFELPVPTAEDGDIFLGWQISVDKTTRMITDEKGKSVGPCNFIDATATPVWKAGKVVLTFDAQGGTLEETTKIVWSGEEFGALPTPTKTDYTFVGWAFDTESETIIKNTDIVVLTEFTTIYAIWEKEVVVKLSFDGNSNTAGEMQDYVSVGITQFTLPKNNFTKDGYTFGGWQLGDAVYNDTAKVVLDIGEYTLKAIWNAISYTVEFQKGEGDVEGTMLAQSFTYDDKQALSVNDFTRKGYIFAGWSLDGKTVAYEDGAVKNFAKNDRETVVLKAIWTPITYRIYFKETADTPNSVCSYRDMQYDKSSILSCSTRFIKTGYRQVGWTQLNGDFVGKEWSIEPYVKNLTSTNGETIELVARWEAITYDIKYQTGNGGTYDIIKIVQDVPYDEVYVLEEPTLSTQKEGYVFGGWRLSNSWLSDEYVGKVFQPGDTVTKLLYYENQEIIVYVVWAPITYTVNVHIENDANTVLTYQKTYDEDLEVSLEGVETTKENYSLQGFRAGHNALGIITWKNAINIREDYCVEQGGTVDVYPLWKYNYQGDGEQQSPYLVDCADAMENMAIVTYLKHAFVWASGESGVRVYFSFTADIDMTGRKFTPIGLYDRADFYGEIQGNGHTVSALNICVPQDITDVSYVGFVSHNFGKISNISFKDSTLNVTADQTEVYAGFMTGKMYSGSVTNCVLENCEINVTNTGDVYAGAFQAYGSYDEILKDVFFKGDINVNAGGEAKVGTIARINGTMDTCAAQANVQITASGKVSFYGVGGTTSAQNCYALFRVNAQGTELAVYESGYEYNSKLSNVYYSDLSTIIFNGDAVVLSENNQTPDENLKSPEWVSNHIPTMRTTGWTMENGYPTIGKRSLDVVEITTQAQFLALSGKNLTEKYILKCDIDMTDVVWEMPSVYGEFDGNGHVIANYTANIFSAKFLALFEDNYGIIKNVIMDNVQIMALTTNGDVHLAGIVVDNKGTVAYCKVRGSLMASVKNGVVVVGGIAAVNNSGWIYCCYTDCILDGSTTVTSNSIPPNAFVFGIAYNDGGVIEHCYTAGNYNAFAKRTSSSGFVENVYIGGVSNIAENSFSLANLTYETSYNKSVWAVAEGLEACSAQTINGTAQSGINEMYLKNEAFLAEKFGWKKYVDEGTLKTDVYAAWSFSANAFPDLYFE